MNLVDSIKQAIKVVNSDLHVTSPIKPLRSTPTKYNVNKISINDSVGKDLAKTVCVHLLTFLRQIENASNEATILTNSSVDCDDVENVPGNRYKLKEVCISLMSKYIVIVLYSSLYSSWVKLTES